MTFCACECEDRAAELSRLIIVENRVRGSIAGFVLLSAFALVESAHAAAPRFVTEIPFRDCDGLICIEVALDGAPARTLMLDTGNANSTLITDVAKALNWKLEPAQRNGGNVPGIFRGGDHRVTLGNVQMPAPFFVFDRELLGAYKPPVDGSLAYNFFKDRVLEIDYPHHVLRISNIISTPVPDRPEGAGSLKLITFGDNGPPIVVGSPFSINGKPVRAQIDTVFTGTMLIYDSAIDRLGLKKQGATTLFRYTDGGVNLITADAQSIGFAGRTILDGKPPLYFPGEGKNPVHQPDNLFEATVGNALFARSVVTMDFHAMTLDVRPAAP